MRAAGWAFTAGLAALLPGAVSAQSRGRYRQPQNDEFTRWDQPLQDSASTPAEPEAAALVTYGTIELNTPASGSLVEHETHYLQFRVAAVSHCILESEQTDDALQIAYLDDASRVVTVGRYAELKAGSYFVRLRSRGKSSYDLTLRCAAQ